MYIWQQSKPVTAYNGRKWVKNNYIFSGEKISM